MDVYRSRQRYAASVSSVANGSGVHCSRAPSGTNTTTDSQTTQSGVASTLMFKATVELKEQSLKLANTDTHLPLAAGMQLSAEIVEGRRTVLQYLLSPVRRVMSEAGMER